LQAVDLKAALEAATAERQRLQKLELQMQEQVGEQVEVARSAAERELMEQVIDLAGQLEESRAAASKVRARITS
jgi:acetyl-CoA carboxylase carboxyltransferase component